MIEVWEQTNTASAIRAATIPGTLEDRVLALFMCWFDPDLFDPKLDFAVRDWAREDATLLAVITDADRQRMETMIAMFVEGGFTGREAIIRARNFYDTQMGYYTLNVQETLSERLSYLPYIFRPIRTGSSVMKPCRSSCSRLPQTHPFGTVRPAPGGCLLLKKRSFQVFKLLMRRTGRPKSPCLSSRSCHLN